MVKWQNAVLYIFLGLGHLNFSVRFLSLQAYLIEKKILYKMSLTTKIIFPYKGVTTPQSLGSVK